MAGIVQHHGVLSFHGILAWSFIGFSDIFTPSEFMKVVQIVHRTSYSSQQPTDYYVVEYLNNHSPSSIAYDFFSLRITLFELIPFEVG
jgi:hypothetical protein